MSLLILRAVNQRGLLPHLRPTPPSASGNAPLLAVIIPARDEEANIGTCLQSLLAQDYPPDRLRILVIDDHSADATAAIVRHFAARDARPELIAAPPLPPHWIGKSHACWVGAQALGPDIEWLCFIDADVKVEPPCLTSALDAALARRLDLLSLVPRQELKSFPERLIMPCGLILLSFVQDLHKAQARSSDDVTATGKFMLIRRDAYEAAGGHAAVWSMICEDLELARNVKRSGRSVLLMGGEELLSTRMYTGWRTLWPGLTKNLVDTLGGPPATLSVALATVILAWAAVVIPLMDAAAWGHAVHGALLALIPASLASGAAFGFHIAATFYFRIPFWYGLLFPLGYTAGALMAFDSVRRRLSGRVMWKGRTYG